MASVDPRDMYLTKEFRDLHRTHEKVIYVQPAEEPHIVSMDLMKPGMTRADLPLVALPGCVASKRKFDQKGMFTLKNNTTNRFAGQNSYLYTDKHTDNLQHNVLASPIVCMPDPDRLFNKTVAHRFNKANLVVPSHLDRKVHQTDRDKLY